MSILFDFSVFPLLHTPRLCLRRICLDDDKAVFQIRGDYEVTKYNSGAAYSTLEQARNLIRIMDDSYDYQSEIRWGITLKASGDDVIGICGFNYWDRANHRASIGYDLARAYWGQGIMPEALHAIIQFGFDRMGLNRVEADCSAVNVASARVLEKLGFQQEGLQRDQYYEDGKYWDLLLFSLLKREYKPPQ